MRWIERWAEEEIKLFFETIWTNSVFSRLLTTVYVLFPTLSKTQAFLFLLFYFKVVNKVEATKYQICSIDINVALKPTTQMKQMK